ncbi:trypsin-like peptidase domain-containing protein [Candidatus Pacearchaeota archaeon]|jgi:S1-C subfamily serine protease|nr:trypsin-like peptidase domain-containing protein [Candidatus Pacearchaeota archaeon]
MVLQRQHKIIIGSVSSLIILFMLLTSIFMYMLFLKQNQDYNELSNKIENLKTETETQFGELSDSVLETKESLTSLGLQIGSIDDEMDNLKASVSSDFSGIIKDSIKSVVTIKTDVSQGSGFFIASGGYVVTNAHVMEGATRATIITYDGESHTVYKLGENSEIDIALLRINETEYEPLNLADSNDVKQGEQVIAIGNPYGLSFSVTQGIVSNIHQAGENGLDAYIQIDAALNSGNSGGPLIDKQGEVIGINNFKISEAEGLGFALESNYIKDTINEIYYSAYEEDLI